MFIINPYRYAAAGGGGLVSISDDFSETLSSWAVQSGTNIADINGGEFRLVTGSFANIFYKHNTPLSTVNQYIKIRTATGVGVSNRWAYLFCRYTDSASPFYYLEMDCQTAVCQWYRRASVAGAATSIGSTFDLGSFSTSSTVGVTVSGAGTAVEFKTWLSPTGSAPTNASTWGGSGASNTTTADPASPVDSGNFVGIGGVQQTANALHLDDFFAGDIP